LEAPTAWADREKRRMKELDSATAAATTHRSDARGSGIDLRQGPYRVREAVSESDRLAAFRLRFSVFNLELREGLETAYASGVDCDEFDPLCDLIIVEHCGKRQVVGTYRLQTGVMAAANLGYYSEREFHFEPYEPLRGSLVELGRACIHREHRSTDVLYLLWRGIAEYATRHGGRYLVGCSSLTSQDAAHGLAVYESLAACLVSSELRTAPRNGFALPDASSQGSSNDVGASVNVHVPKLLRTYLVVGAKICGPPALDRDFKTIDFLTLLDLEKLHPRVRARFFPKV